MYNIYLGDYYSIDQDVIRCDMPLRAELYELDQFDYL